MRQFYVKKNEELAPDKLGKILSEFQTHQLPELKKRYNYYLGKQAILQRPSADDGKPHNKIVCNFVRSIVDTYEGYAVGIPVTYENDDASFENILEILKYNDVVDEDSEMFRKALIFGRVAELNYIDEEGKQRFKNGSPLEWIPVYDDTVEGGLVYAIRFWETDLVENNQPVYHVEVHGSQTVKVYNSAAGFRSFNLIEERPHNFNQVPVTFFSLNEEEEGVAVQIFRLQDAYNSLLSDSIDDWDSFCDAYLVIKGGMIEEDSLKNMKKNRCLLMDEEDDAYFLTKNTTATEIRNLLTTAEEKIREMSSCPNFASEAFGTSSGIAIRYRLMALQNNVGSMWNNFRKALQKRIELIASVEALKEGSETAWRDVKITFTPNIPLNTAETAQEVNSFRGLVSDKTLLSQIPFVQDVDSELELIRQQKAESIEMYGFTMAESELEEDE